MPLTIAQPRSGYDLWSHDAWRQRQPAMEEWGGRPGNHGAGECKQLIEDLLRRSARPLRTEEIWDELADAFPLGRKQLARHLGSMRKAGTAVLEMEKRSGADAMFHGWHPAATWRLSSEADDGA